MELINIKPTLQPIGKRFLVRNEVEGSRITINESQTGLNIGELRVDGIMGIVDVMNENKRYYPRAEYQKWVDNIMSRIASGEVIFGEWEHPKTMTIDPDRIVWKIEKVWIDDDGLVHLTAVIIPTTRSDNFIGGEDLIKLARAGYELRPSTRATGTIAQDGRVTLDEMKTVDCVKTPGFGQYAKVVPVMESKTQHNGLTICESFYEINEEEDTKPSDIEKENKTQENDMNLEQIKEAIKNDPEFRATVAEMVGCEMDKKNEGKEDSAFDKETVKALEDKIRKIKRDTATLVKEASDEIKKDAEEKIKEAEDKADKKVEEALATTSLFIEKSLLPFIARNIDAMVAETKKDIKKDVFSINAKYIEESLMPFLAKNIEEEYTSKVNESTALISKYIEENLLPFFSQTIDEDIDNRFKNAFTDIERWTNEHLRHKIIDNVRAINEGYGDTDMKSSSKTFLESIDKEIAEL